MKSCDYLQPCPSSLTGRRQAVEDRGERGGTRFLDEFVLGTEAAVEAAVPEPGGGHQVGEPRRDNTALAELFRRDRHDPLARLRCLPFRLSHSDVAPWRSGRIFWIEVDI
jgi:hypothetical protein